MKPIVGITCQYNDIISKDRFDVKSSYADSLAAAGAVPVIIPIIDNKEDISRYFDMIHGIVFTGGSDISPLFYGENPLKHTDQICHKRDQMEFRLLETALERKVPILGICRGQQIINIAFGGTLYQDIPSQVPNSYGHVSLSTMRDGYHEIDIMKDGYLYEIFQRDRLIVNSLHHQGIKDLGHNLKVVAKSNDGIIEGIQSTEGSQVYGVQFHPEDLTYKHGEFLKIFEYFINML